jgi:hypothetical protein
MSADIQRILRLAFAAQLVPASVLTPSLDAQSYFAAEYNDVTATSKVDVERMSITIWLTAHFGGDGYRFVYEPGASTAPSLTWWTRTSDVSRIRVRCSAPSRGQLTVSCPLTWPSGLSVAEFEAELRGAGALPLPQPVSLRTDANGYPPPPCPNDGFHLWIVAQGTESNGKIEFCNYDYRWADARAPARVDALLQRILREVVGMPWQLTP